MTVSAINGSYSSNGSCVGPMAQGAVIGAAVGYGMKYAYPLHKDEKNTKEYIHVMGTIENKKSTFSPWTQTYIDTINSKANKSLEEDIFVKTFDGLKDGDKVGTKRILNAFRTLEEQKPNGVGVLKRLFEDSRIEAEKVAKKAEQAYKMATKNFRPTGFFLATGAVVGASVALLHDVMKTDVTH